jgi:DNA-directed RNA polymerase sigma subunit (sigma70/sigma32)
MKQCVRECLERNYECDKNECRMWLDFEEDFNCSLIAIHKHGEMTLEQVGERIGVSFVRIRQIEQLALQKVKKRGRELSIKKS